MMDAPLDYLSQSPLKHMDMIVPIERGTAHILYAAKDGVCLKEMKSGAYMMSVVSHEAGKKLIETLPKSGLFTFHQDFMKKDFEVNIKYETFIENYQAVYFGKELLSTSDNMSLKPLNDSHFGIIVKNYDVNVGEDYLSKLIEEGNLFGGFVDSRLIGFVGIHAEGSIGLLKVFDEYLGKGYGTMLVRHITNHQLSLSDTPFAQVGINNEASLAVFRKLGYSISDERVYWAWS